MANYNDGMCPGFQNRVGVTRWHVPSAFFAIYPIYLGRGRPSNPKGAHPFNHYAGSFSVLLASSTGMLLIWEAASVCCCVCRNHPKNCSH